MLKVRQIVRNKLIVKIRKFIGIGNWISVISKGGPIPLFSDTFDTKYRVENCILIPMPIHIAIC